MRGLKIFVLTVNVKPFHSQVKHSVKQILPHGHLKHRITISVVYSVSSEQRYMFDVFNIKLIRNMVVFNHIKLM